MCAPCSDRNLKTDAVFRMTRQDEFERVMYIYSCCKRLHAKYRLGKTKLLEIVSTSNIRAVSYVLTILDGYPAQIPSAPDRPMSQSEEAHRGGTGTSRTR